MKLIPASKARWMIRMDSSWSALPQAPNIMAPRQNGLTFRPVRPSVRYSIASTLRAPVVNAVGNDRNGSVDGPTGGRRRGRRQVRLAISLNYAANFKEAADQAVAFEKAGADIVWVAEAYGFDAPSQMGYLAAKTERILIGSGILPIYSRTPALLAQTAAGVDSLSNGRAILGIGASGPQVIEGWHGVAYDRPLERTREIIDLCRRGWRREVLTNDGLYPIPLPGGQGTGLGKAVKIINHPVGGT